MAELPTEHDAADINEPRNAEGTKQENPTPTPEQIEAGKKNIQIMDLAEFILKSDEVVPEAMLLYMKKVIENQNLKYKEPNPKCKLCNGRGWVGYIPIKHDDRYPGRLPIACKCIVEQVEAHKGFGLPKYSGKHYNRKARRKLMKYQQVFKKVPTGKVLNSDDNSTVHTPPKKEEKK